MVKSFLGLQGWRIRPIRTIRCTNNIDTRNAAEFMRFLQALCLQPIRTLPAVLLVPRDKHSRV